MQPVFYDTIMELNKSGRIRHWGFSPDTLKQGISCPDIPEIEVLQLDVSLFSGNQMNSFLIRTKEIIIGIITREVLE